MEKELSHKEKLMQLTLCKKNQKMGYFFREKNFLAHSRDKQLVMMIMRIPKNCLFYQKCRNLSDLNDLYNAQDVILLLEIIENRFQGMQNECGYNPRKVNSASKLSGYIQREQSKINQIT